MYASGLFVVIGSMNAVFDFDNIQISCQSSENKANIPQVFLSRIGQTEEGDINLNLRAYTINFLEGETLWVTGTDGHTSEVNYSECNGEYTYETATSGIMQSWTTIGNSASDIVYTDIDCTPIVLPQANATLKEISDGFNKIYTLTVDNTDVPLSPNILIDWEYITENGTNSYEKDCESGVTAYATGGNGQLQITTHAPGYESGFLIIKNDKEFEKRSVWDFARMSEDQIRETGFPEFEILNSSNPSGFKNWTARKRLYYQIYGSEHENEAGIMVRDLCYPFGFVSEDSETQIIKYSIIDRTGIESTFSGEFFDGLTIFPESGRLGYGNLPNIGMMHRIGLFNNQSNNNYNKIYVNDLEPTDIIIVNTIDDYGLSSIHPVCATEEEYYDKLAGEDTIYFADEDAIQNDDTGLYDFEYPLYRISSAITKIIFFGQLI